MADEKIKVRYLTEHGHGYVTEYKPDIAEILLDRGVVELVDDAVEEVSEPEISAAMRKDELAAIAIDRGIEITDMTKAEILETLRETED